MIRLTQIKRHNQVQKFLLKYQKLWVVLLMFCMGSYIGFIIVEKYIIIIFQKTLIFSKGIAFLSTPAIRVPQNVNVGDKIPNSNS